MWELIYLLITCGLCTNVQLIDNAVESISMSGSLENPDKGHKDYVEIRDGLRDVIVTKHGPVRGFEKDGVLQFFDIPYGAFQADSPFQEPTEPEEWRVTREVDSHKSRCPQINSEDTYVGDNECLTLNIFKPYSTDAIQNGEYDHSAEDADVLFHIHDGSFSSGSGDPLIYDPKNLVSKGIILVLPNYRLGPLGFLCLNNETAPGNAALKDLTLALKWTRENIEAFGGNFSNIVVSGAGAGGALVEYLILSNMSRIYFSKAITESGFSVSPWALDRYPLDTASSLLQNIVKKEENAEKQIVYGVFDQIDLELLVRGAVNIGFKPCVENETGFITETPWQILLSHSFPVTLMSGSANQAAMERALRHTPDTLSRINSDLSLLLPSDLIFENNEDQIKTGREVKTLYFGEGNITLEGINQLSQCYSDSGYLNPGIRGARLLVKGGASVYFYEISFNDPNSERGIDGSARGDSLAFVFRNNEQTTEGERQIEMRNTMTDIWVSFIKIGRPLMDNVAWNNLRDVEAAEEEWLSIGAEVQMKKGLHIDRLRMWEEIYKNHFVENNLGFIYKPSIYILASILSALALLGVTTI